MCLLLNNVLYISCIFTLKDKERETRLLFLHLRREKETPLIRWRETRRRKEGNKNLVHRRKRELSFPGCRVKVNSRDRQDIWRDNKENVSKGKEREISCVTFNVCCSVRQNGVKKPLSRITKDLDSRMSLGCFRLHIEEEEASPMTTKKQKNYCFCRTKIRLKRKREWGKRQNPWEILLARNDLLLVMRE